MLPQASDSSHRDTRQRVLDAEEQQVMYTLNK